ncbi:MAG: CRISPR-associated endonuclease Cas2 [Desulfurella sp.]|jgi:CRISPR-associated endonuclease Cas2|uniref:CRISPR-associated endoribonuclease Cas2 n=1 Tax=Desulfurella multipotens TaxID=79269 RepID=A0A1G6M8E9_9BACT|nr:MULTISPECIES: CRISPR-associated endonuclease Cas2 [Desulfurella]PMP67234.1 MAG: CRISPR-associated endonuclease Cas2 [Desulfurella multipotens]PMP93552.1 MAG: CRISPR-associated endonuclease Cas2 [Desulfurella sp.]SDC51266.1 CRISPR associated protein Cas2 [Desulfurella multipotens]
MTKNYVVIYDITDSKNRYKIARFLFEYGIRTQYSVFEVEVKNSQFNKFIGLLGRKIKKPADKIYIYQLDKNNLKNIQRIGNYENSVIFDFFV